MQTINQQIEAEVEAEAEALYNEVLEELKSHGRIVSLTYYRYYGITYTKRKALEGDTRCIDFLRELRNHNRRPL